MFPKSTPFSLPELSFSRQRPLRHLTAPLPLSLPLVALMRTPSLPMMTLPREPFYLVPLSITLCILPPMASHLLRPNAAIVQVNSFGGSILSIRKYPGLYPQSAFLPPLSRLHTHPLPQLLSFLFFRDHRLQPISIQRAHTVEPGVRELTRTPVKCWRNSAMP